MAKTLHIHPETPQLRLIKEAATILKDGGLAVLPTDCCDVLACAVGDKNAMERLRQVRAITDKHLLTLMCRDLSDLGSYAHVDNAQYRFLKAATPGAYTFILDASKELPRRILSPKRKTIGVRIPDSVLIDLLITELDEPLITSSLILPGETDPLTDLADIEDRAGKLVDVIIDNGTFKTSVTTVLDLTGNEITVVRAGAGELEPLGLSED